MKEILQLKNDFNSVKILRGDILNVFDTLDSKLQVLKKIYVKLLGLHNESAYMFGIDSFYFQNKLIKLEFTNLKDMQRYIENRMYCEYYQLHMLVQEYVLKEVVSENVRNKIAVKKKYPAYKNLDPRRVYDFNLVIELHDHIIISIVELESYREAKVAELETDTAQSKLGLNIGNLVNSHRFYNALLKEKISMFIRYLQVFHEHHTKYFTRLNIKSKLIIGIINEDIQIKQFNPTGKSVPPQNNYNTTTSNQSGNVMSEQETIKSFVNCEDSDDSDVLKSALDTIMSNIPNETGNSRGLYAPGNNSSNGVDCEANQDNQENQENQGTQNIIISRNDFTMSKQTNERDIESIESIESIEPSEGSDIQSDSIQSHVVGSEVSDYDDGKECVFNKSHIGRRVLVEGYDSVGTLRFVGNHKIKDVTRCGVELDDDVGKNNGTVGGVEYFKTEHNKGVLVSPRKVSFLDFTESEL